MSISQNTTYVRELINQAEKENQRDENSVLLLAVSKKQSTNLIDEAYRSGLHHFGENYYQEALSKIEALKHLPLHWHFIGPIQSNKAKGIASHFHWVHSINRLLIAQLLNEYRPSYLPPLNVCLQVNLIPEETKSGIAPEEVQALACSISKLPHLKLRGLMTIPPPQKNPELSYNLFRQLSQLMISINQSCDLEMDTLSMGMSKDLVPAIKAGASIVRVGEVEE